MALDIALQQNILKLTNAHWVTHAQDQGFAEIIHGKEPGHRMADYVDDRTCSLLKVHLDTRYEGDTKGNVRKRSMGDIWVHSQGIFNPLNVKSGLQDMNGQPNLVSMQRLLDYILKRWIDSYYLLVIKFDVSAEPTHKAYLVDILDWTDFITYDAGPGQIMLRERDFYNAYESGYTPVVRTVPEKAEILFALFEQQLEALFVNRRARLRRQRAMLSKFRRRAFAVNQSEIRFVP